MKNDYYNYVYFRPNGIPCYIGKGRRHRWLEHARLGVNHYNKHFARIFAKAGGSLPRAIIRSGLTDAQATETEIALIAAIGRGKSGPLVNLTDGGDGTSGWKHSIEARERIAKAVSERVVKDSTREKLRAANLGKVGTPKDEAFKEMIRAFHTGRVKSDAERLAISRGKMGHSVSEEARAKIRAALTGRKNGPLREEHRAKLRAAQIIIIDKTIIDEVLATPRSVAKIARKYSLPRRTLNERVLEARRAA